MENHVTTVSLVERSGRSGEYTLVDPTASGKVHDPMDLVEIARQVQKADEFTRANASNKLMTIAEQIRHLQEQAKKVLQEAKRDADLHHAACNIKKRPGQMYYLYKRESGQQYFSILSRQEWGASCPHEYVGAYKLEYDMSWTPAENVEQRGQEIALIDKLLNSQASIAYPMEPNFEPLVSEKIRTEDRKE
ncbi:uncharacterized protein C1orf50 homolog [Glandiceps talaboti]